MLELAHALFHDFMTENKALSFTGPSLWNNTPETTKRAFNVHTLNPFSATGLLYTP